MLKYSLLYPIEYMSCPRRFHLDLVRTTSNSSNFDRTDYNSIRGLFQRKLVLFHGDI
jgi:hypothetical protein